MLNVSAKEYANPLGGSSSAVLTGRMAGKNRRLPVAECLAVVDWSCCAHWDNYGCGSSAPTLPRYAFLIISAFSKMNGGC